MTTVAPAATLVLLRPAADRAARRGFEVLLTRRPDSMRFGPGMHVFPGGRLEPGEDAATAAVRETREETGIEVDPTTLVPLTRWVTPPGLPARFDARFFAAIVAPNADVRHASDEVAGWAWLPPTRALESFAVGRLAMWQPTLVTLQQLESVVDPASLASAFAPDPTTDPPERQLDARTRPDLRRVATSWLAGIEGSSGITRVAGRRAWVVISPGDPTDETIDALIAAATAEEARLVGIVLEDLDPRRHAGVEQLARGLGLPVAAPPGADRLVPYPVRELVDGEVVPFGDVELEVVVERAPRSLTDGVVAWADRAAAIRLRATDGEAID